MRALTVFLFPIRILLTILLSPFFTIGYITLIILIAIPSHLLRKLVSLIGHCLDRDLCKLVSATSSVAARDFHDWYTKPSQSICTVLKFKGHLDLPTCRQHVLNKLVHRRNPNGGGLLEYPELQQYCTTRLGYLFYKWDRKFNIEDHVQLYQSKKLLPSPGTDIVDDAKLIEIWEDTVILPFQAKRSPWKIFLIHNYIPDGMEGGDIYSALILKAEHSLMDGLSTYRLILSLLDDGIQIWNKEIASRPVPKCFSTMLHLKGMLLGPTHILWAQLKGPDFHNPVHIPLRKKVGETYLATTTLDLEFLKKIRRAHLDVSLHAVLIEGISGGLRSYFIRNGLRIPYFPIRLGIPLPTPGHTSKLRDQYLSTCVELHVHKKKARERLFAIERSLKELRNGAVTPFLTQGVTLIGGMPVKWARTLTSNSGFTVLYSEMRGPETTLTMGNGEYDVDELEDVLFAIPLGADDVDIAFSSISYKGKVNFVLGMDKSIAKSREKAQELLYYIKKEIEELQYGDSTNL